MRVHALFTQHKSSTSSPAPPQAIPDGYQTLKKRKENATKRARDRTNSSSQSFSSQTLHPDCTDPTQARRGGLAKVMTTIKAMGGTIRPIDMRLREEMNQAYERESPERKPRGLKDERIPNKTTPVVNIRPINDRPRTQRAGVYVSDRRAGSMQEEAKGGQRKERGEGERERSKSLIIMQGGGCRSTSHGPPPAAHPSAQISAEAASSMGRIQEEEEKWDDGVKERKEDREGERGRGRTGAKSGSGDREKGTRAVSNEERRGEKEKGGDGVEVNCVGLASELMNWSESFHAGRIDKRTPSSLVGLGLGPSVFMLGGSSRGCHRRSSGLGLEERASKGRRRCCRNENALATSGGSWIPSHREGTRGGLHRPIAGADGRLNDWERPNEQQLPKSLFIHVTSGLHQPHAGARVDGSDRWAGTSQAGMKGRKKERKGDREREEVEIGFERQKSLIIWMAADVELTIPSYGPHKVGAQSRAIQTRVEGDEPPEDQRVAPSPQATGVATNRVVSMDEILKRTPKAKDGRGEGTGRREWVGRRMWSWANLDEGQQAIWVRGRTMGGLHDTAIADSESRPAVVLEVDFDIYKAKDTAGSVAAHEDGTQKGEEGG
ncbi:hypothetical protein DFP72DRAFT_1050789 [Ephemerocybe angulata]|uniref:Uncharacterized protein n=1 Tax=Ephemerocybe angulata TaxID=980116 RepID=A0A8H6LZM6_9AGAR|nr:hypothetical protein DFP72DRAFT_1050789 [Tulosesus angulatus]